jgi:tetratricopeptide (TPR) repeat protein
VLKPSAITVALIVACAVAFDTGTSARAVPSAIPVVADRLTESARLSSVYDAILASHDSDAEALLARACPPAPTAACDDLREVMLWWDIQQDLSSRSLDARFEAASRAALASSTAGTVQAPTRAENWFYLAAAYGPLAQWRILRGDRLTAARDGKRVKDALERALSLDTRLEDAWFGIGLYHYYADVVPSALKLLRFLLLMPGGDRVQGMREMLRAREHGEPLRGEADFQLHWLYLWYEQQPTRALDLLHGLDRRYPSNPLFLQRIADVQHVYLHDHRASARTWQTLLDRAAASQVAFAAIADARARLGLAAESTELSEPQHAIDLLTSLLRSRPVAPYGVVSLADVALGDAYARAEQRQAAIDAYTRAIGEAPKDDPDGVRARGRDGLARIRARR